MTTPEISLLVAITFGTISIITVVITAWINIRIKIASLEVKITQTDKDIREGKTDLDKHKDDYRKDLTRLYDKQEQVLQVVNDIKVDLQKKQDRP